MMQHQLFEERLRLEGYAHITTVTREAGYALGEHSHPFDACALITQGSISLTIGPTSRNYEVGDVFTLAAQVVHSEAAGALGVTYCVGRRYAADQL